VRLLLDTQCFLWWFTSPERLNQMAIDHILDQNNDLFLSMASSWEIAIKVSIGKLPLPEPADTYIASRLRLLGAKHLDILFPHVCQVSLLPQIHRDPFDRLLVVQAQLESLTIVTADENVAKYDASTLWAKR
jgi:PIN domain nuclease of toxin-antitoxin system